MAKTLYFLIGPKGSGKTHIGTYVHENSDIHFLRVEPIWLQLREGENGWQNVIAAVDRCFLRYHKVMIENLGAGDDFNQFLHTLQKRYQTKLIKVETDLDLCFQRVKTRNNKNHIPVSDDKVQQYNTIAAAVVLDWDLVIDNNGKQGLEDIKDRIMKL